MFDFLKLVNSDEGFSEKLRNNELLDFKRTYNERTFELEDKWEAEFDNLAFTLHPSGRVEIAGSLHKYKNKGVHNYDDFLIEDLKKVLKDLGDKFALSMDTTTVHHLEYGLNVRLPFSPSKFLDSVISFKTTPFQNMKTFGKAQAKEAILSQYKIKIYDKALQYDLSDNTLRFERKVNKMESIQKGKVFLSQLTSDIFIENCFGQLFDSFKNLVVFEKLDRNKIPKSERENLDKYDNPRFWKNLAKNKRHYHKQKFKDLKMKYAKESLQSDILKVLEEKKNLVYPKNEKFNLLTDIKNLKTLPIDSLINKSTSNRLASA